MPLKTKTEQDSILQLQTDIAKAKPRTIPTVILKDALPVSILLGLGAVTQLILTLLVSLVPKIPFFGYTVHTSFLVALVPICILFRPIVKLFLIHYGLINNPHMQHVVPHHSIPVLPGSEPKDGGSLPPEYCVIFLGARCNSALGVFDPKFGVIAEQISEMQKELARDPELGCWNSDNYIQVARDTNNTVMTIFYFESVEKMQNYIKGKIHSLAEKVYYENYENTMMIEIWHELFTIKEGGSEAIYINAQPRGLGNIWTRLPPSDLSKEELWENSLRRPAGRFRNMRKSVQRMGGSN